MQRISLSACALAVAGTFAATASYAAPTVSWSKPSSGATLSGSVTNSQCAVGGQRIKKVDFFVVNSSGVAKLVDTDTVSGWNCDFDSRLFPNGSYTLRAVAYDGSNRKATANRSVKISNGTTSGSTGGNTPPTVTITSPQAGATLKGYVDSSMCGASATDSDGIAKVEFFLNDKLVKSDGTNPYQCNVETTLYPDGTYQLIAKATDSKGGIATAQREVKIANGGTVSEPTSPPPSTSTIDGADILGRSMSDLAFAQQTGYNGQVLGTYPSVQSIPEAGIHGSVLPNGESIRMGKQADPTNGARKAIVFQLAPSDPNTSGSKRSEFKFPNILEFDKTYWTAFKVFIPDWGQLASDDTAVFGMQLHSGLSSAGHPPSVGITAIDNGRNLRIRVQGDNTSRQDYVRPIPFGRWVDFVFKVRQSSSSGGVMQAWMDGQQIANYAGPWGWKTSEKDYFKYGYYNYSSGFNSPRKVLMRNAIIVSDPSGGKYGPDALRAAIQ